MAEVAAQAQVVAELVEDRDLGDELDRAADQNAAGQGEDRLLHARRHDQRGPDHGQVEQYRRERRQEEMAGDIEHTGKQGHQADEEDVREHHPVEQVGQGQLAGAAGKTVADQLDQPG